MQVLQQLINDVHDMSTYKERKSKISLYMNQEYNSGYHCLH